MTEKSEPQPTGEAPPSAPPTKGADDRQIRRASALRENLRRRKTAARAAPERSS